MHSHILPGVDDGCRTLNESRSILRLCVEQGVGYLAATPHYYGDEPVSRFLEKRNTAAEQLMEMMGDEACPQICLGAEVAYYPGMEYEDCASELCLGKSNYILFEMPFTRWTPGVLSHVRAFVHRQCVVPIFAHVERYLRMQDKRTMEDFLSIGVLIQMNNSFLLARSTRRKAVRLLRKGFVDVMGSDCHNLSTRPPNTGEACLLLEKTGLSDVYAQMNRTMQSIFEEAISGDQAASITGRQNS